MPHSYVYKVYRSGNVIEVYQYDEPRFLGFARKQSIGNRMDQLITVVDEKTGELVTREMTEKELADYIEEKQMFNRAKSNIRARNEIRRKALANFDSKSSFLTLTFQENLQDLDIANRVFRSFVKYMRRDLKEKKWSFKYLAVIEFQERGAIHYHLLCDLPKYYSYSRIRNRWRQSIGLNGVNGTGSIKHVRIDRVDNVGAYIVKYMTKAKADKRLVGKKMYQTSQGLKKPVEVSFKTEDELKCYLENFGINEYTKKAYQNNYTDVFTLGEVKYTEYNLER